MRAKMSKGHFGRFGARAHGNAMEFTFEVTSECTPYIILYSIKDKSIVEEIPVEEEYSLGRVYSVCIEGYQWKNLCYMLRFTGEPVLDPFAPVIVGRNEWMDEERIKDNYRIFGGFNSEEYKWSVDRVVIPPEQMIIYKLHMRGFTMTSGLSSAKRGNYKGIIQKLPYFKEMGITTLEFMPLYDFEEIKYHFHYKLGKDRKTVMVPEEPIGTNYWGYGGACYFAPKASYFGGVKPDLHFKEMVDAIHAAGMEIIMEFSFVERTSDDFILDCLINWVREYRVDGFHLVGMGLPISRIANNAFLGRTKIFYDSFPHEVLSRASGKKHLFVVNDEFVYPLRRLQNHLDGTVAEFSNYMRRQGNNYSFVNYAASNTGFTLWDAYSYGEKHNDGNGEDNSDGNNYNCSHNHGCEGETANRIINKNRMNAMRTAMCAVFLSQGIPLIWAGDEVANSQSGNNNPYCQDNEIGWTTFSRRKAPKMLREYICNLIDFRKKHSILSMPQPMKMNDYHHTGVPDLSYHGREPWIMGIGDEKKALGILYNSSYAANEGEDDVMICLNFYYGEETFALPKLAKGKKWYKVTNTNEEEWNPSDTPLKDQGYFGVPGGSISILVGK